jgi:putative FmdB family regulatory protein
MPIYEYRCSVCGHELEALQKFSDAPLASCPSCHGDTLVKLLSAAGFQLKGSGWYATDFKSSGAKPAPAKAADTPSSGTDARSDGAAAGAAKGEPTAAPRSDAKSETASGTSAPAAKAGTPPAAT